MKIVFFGTPDFAVATLDAILQAGFDVVGVVTAMDKPAGRNLQPKASAVKEYALTKGLKVLQPSNLKSPGFLEELKKLQADVQVVVAFRMLPEAVWNMPPLGTYNLHASLLPDYRGAAPINHAIIQGEKTTGVTTFKLQHAIDTGDIALQEKVPIEEEDNAGTLHDKLMNVGANLMVETLNRLKSNTLVHQPQSHIPEESLKHAPKIFPDFLEINWNKKGRDIFNFVRGLSPYPGSCTYLDGKKLKIFSVKYVQDTSGLKPGSIRTDSKNYLHFGTSDGYVEVTELQMEGKKRMTVSEFLRGYRISEQR